jgi:hypothetical protein
MESVAELKAWISQHVWKQEQVAGWVDRYFIRKGAQAFLNGLEVAGVLLVKTATAASVQLQSTGSSGRHWLWQTAATGSTAAGTTAGDVYLYDNTAGAYRVKVDSAGLMTVPGGIAFANETLSTFDEGTWTPAITSSNADFSTTYTSQSGTYWRFNNLVHYTISIVLNTISAAGTGDLRISLPIAAVTAPPGNVRTIGVDIPGTPFAVNFLPVGAQAYGRLIASNDDAAATVVAITALANSDQISVSGFYSV